MPSPLRCARCGHSLDVHDLDTDWSGCCGRNHDGTSCHCREFVYPEPDTLVKDEPLTRRLFVPRDLVKLDPREPYAKEDED